MTTMTILRGVPASGKSTQAEVLTQKNARLRRVSRDDIRFQVFGRYTGVDEDLVTKIEHASIEAILKAGDDVLVDATNLNRKFVNGLLRLAAKHGAEVKYEDMQVSLSRALQNDSVRGSKGDRFVGRTVIEAFFKRYKIDPVSGVLPPPPSGFPPLPLYIPDTSKPPAYGFDLDGTLALRCCPVHPNGY